MKSKDSSADLLLRLIDQVASSIAASVKDCVRSEVPAMVREALEPDLLSEANLSKRTGLSQRQLRHRRKRGELAYVKRGRKVFYEKAEVDRWVKEAHVPRKPIRCT